MTSFEVTFNSVSLFNSQTLTLVFGIVKRDLFYTFCFDLVTKVRYPLRIAGRQERALEGGGVTSTSVMRLLEEVKAKGKTGLQTFHLFKNIRYVKRKHD